MKGKRLTIAPGNKYGRLTIIKETDLKNKSRWFICKCECGTIKEFKLSQMMRTTNPSRSCGCYRKDICVQRNTKHNLSRTDIYHIWQAMIERCVKREDPRFKWYGGRGINVCQEWEINFLSFYNWAINSGYKKGLTIERIDNNGDYNPVNCKWATQTEQNRNKRSNHFITYNGEKLCLQDWANRIGICGSTLSKRLKKWGINRALTTPPSKIDQHGTKSIR